METELFTFIAKLNRDLYVYYKGLEVTNGSFNIRSQGDVIKYPTAPVIFCWSFKWENPKINHEMTFEIWKDEKWTVRSEHNTEEVFDFANPLKGEFLFDYPFESVNDMINNIEKIKEEFIEIFEERINL